MALFTEFYYNNKRKKERETEIACWCVRVPTICGESCPGCVIEWLEWRPPPSSIIPPEPRAEGQRRGKNITRAPEADGWMDRCKIMIFLQSYWRGSSVSHQTQTCKILSLYVAHTHTRLHHPQQVVIPKWQNRQSGVVKGMLTTLDGGSYTSPLVTLAPWVTVITWEEHLAGWCFFDHPFVAGAEGRAGEERRRLDGKESGFFQCWRSDSSSGCDRKGGKH